MVFFLTYSLVASEAVPAPLWLVGELMVLKLREFASTGPIMDNALQNIPPDRNRDPLRRPGEKLKGLCRTQRGR